jgi:signal transduction histidine kinase
MYPRRRWLVVLAALAFVGSVEALSDSVLDVMLPFPLDTVFVLSAVAAVALTAAWFAFRLIDRLTGDLMERHEALKSSNAALRAVYDVSLAVSGQADPELTLAAIVDHARDLLRVDAALLALRGPEDELTLRAASAKPGVLVGSAAPTEARTAAGAVPVGPGSTVPPAAPSTGGPGDLSRYLRPGYAIGIEAPIGHGSTRVGTLALAMATPRRFSESDVEVLSALATQVGLALEAARLRDELQALAVQGERERIAREMHDGLAQVLAYVNTKSQAVEELLAANRVSEARRQLEELASAARSVYVDVREAILTLSPPVLPERGLVSALEEYAARYAESSKLAVRFQASPQARETQLTPEVQAEMFGVAREALTNVRKHAHAGRVGIALSADQNEMILLITDDGVGFDTESAGSGPERWPHFGLAGMRERAGAVGGRIVWRSRLGSGSEVELRVPVKSSVSNLLQALPVPSSAKGHPMEQHQAVRSTKPTRTEAD